MKSASGADDVRTDGGFELAVLVPIVLFLVIMPVLLYLVGWGATRLTTKTPRSIEFPIRLKEPRTERRGPADAEIVTLSVRDAPGSP